MRCRVILLFLLLAGVLTGCEPMVQPEQMTKQLTYARVQADVAIAQTLMQQQRYAQAKIQLLCALAVAPHSVLANLQLAAYYQQIRRPQRAGQVYQQALQHWPDNALVQWRYGDFLCHQGDRVAGLQLLQRAVQINDVPEAVQLQISLAQCATKAQRYTVALHAYQQAVQLAPENAVTYLPYARLLLQQHQLKQAQNMVQSYWRIKPEDEPSLKLALLIAAAQRDSANQAYYQLSLNSYLYAKGLSRSLGS